MEVLKRIKKFLIYYFIKKEWIEVFCGECGTKNEKGAAYCENCGAKLEENEVKE